MKKWAPALLTLGAVCGLAIAAVPGSAIVAEINGKKITRQEFDRKYEENKKYFQFRVPSREDVLNDLVKRELGVQEAKRLGLQNDPEIQERVDTVLYHALLEKMLGKQLEDLKISDDDVRNFYSRNPEIRTSHIFIGLAPNASKDDEAKAMARLKEIQKILAESKKSFAEIAQEYSEGVAAPMGGDIDFQSKDRLDPAYYRAASELKDVGKVSGIVRSQFGLHIIKLTAIRKYADADKNKIRRMIFEERRQQTFDKYMATLRQKARVTLNPQSLN